MEKISNNIFLNNGGTTLDVYVMEQIGANWWDGSGVTKTTILNEIKGKKLKAINLNISSPGGDVDEALAIKDMLIDTGAPITANVSGLTASAATIIMMAAGKINMSADARLLIHNASTWGEGNKEDFRKVADTLDIIDNLIADLYVRKSGNTDKQAFLDEMQKNQWIGPDRAKELGIVDEVVEKIPVSNMTKAAIKNAVSNKLITLPTGYSLEDTNEVTAMSETKTAIENLNKGFEAFGNKILDAIKALVPKVKNASSTTKDGKTIYYDGELAVGTKCYEDEAMTTMCGDGEYTIGENTYTVAGGEVTKVTPFVDPAADDTTANNEALQAELTETKEQLTAANTQVENLKKQLIAAQTEVETVRNQAKTAIENIGNEFTAFKSTIITGGKLNPELEQQFKEEETETPKNNKTALEIAAEVKRKEREAREAAKK